MKENKLYIGNINSGKTLKIMKDVKKLIKEGKNIIILDTKNEYIDLFKDTNYEMMKIDMHNMKDSMEINPFELAYKYYNNGNIDMALQSIKDIGSILYKSTSAQDPFWDNSANSLFVSICLYLLENNREISFKEIIKVCEADFDKFSDYVNKKDVLDTISILASSIVNSPKETKGGIIAVMKLVLGYIGTMPNLLEKSSTKNEILLKDNNQVLIINNFDRPIFANTMSELLLIAVIDKIYDEKKECYIILDNYDTIINKDIIESIFEYCNSKNVSCIVGTRYKENIKNSSVFKYKIIENK